MLLAVGWPAAAAAQVLTLEDAIRQACANSDSAKMMNETITKAQQVVRQNWSAAYPKFATTIFGGRALASLASAGASGGSSTGGGSLGKAAADTLQLQIEIDSLKRTVGGLQGDLGGMGSQFADMMKPQQTEIYSTSVSVTQPIFTFGKIGTAIHVARQYDSSAHCSHDRGLQQLQLLALDTYYRALLAQMTVQVDERSMARKQELSDFLDRNFKMGSGSKARLLSALADVKSQWADNITARQNARAAMMYLNALIGRPIADTLQLDTASTPAALQAATLPSEQDAVQSALGRRGDLRAFEYLAKANAGGAHIYRAMYLPSIAAQGSLGFSGTDLPNLFDWDKYGNWTIGVGLQWAFFDGFANSAKAAQFRSDARKMQILHDSFSRLIEIEARTALQECAAADSNLTASQQALAAAQESYDLTNSDFKQGSGQFADLQLAEERLRQAELGRLNARYRSARSRAALLVAMGNDLVALEAR
jgi:HAE1 family hydrophobic/amphiphilic exporter-1